MKKGDLFLLLVSTLLCVLLFGTAIPECCAVGIFVSIPTIIGWASFLNNLKN
jgi:hypothetical protein